MDTINMEKFWKRILANKFIKFLLVGGCSTALDFGIYMLLSARNAITLSKGISMLVASIFSYAVNKSFTFKNRDKTDIGYIIRFYLVFAANFGTNLLVNYLVYHAVGYKLVAFAAATVCGMVVNYIGQRFFVFEQRK